MIWNVNRINKFILECYEWSWIQMSLFSVSIPDCFNKISTISLWTLDTALFNGVQSNARIKFHKLFEM